MQQRKATRRNRATLQLLVLACLALLSLGIYLLVRWSRAMLFGSTPTPAQVLAMSVMDVGRIYLMQNIGREVLLYLSRWDDDISSTQVSGVASVCRVPLFNQHCCLFQFSSLGVSFSASADVSLSMCGVSFNTTIFRAPRTRPSGTSASTFFSTCATTSAQSSSL